MEELDLRDLGAEGQEALEKVLGHLNFSAGTPDAQFLANLNLLFGRAARKSAEDAPERKPNWRRVVQWLTTKLACLSSESAVFADSGQARAVLDLVRTRVLAGYRKFHRDLLYHHTYDSLVGPFMLGRVFEAVLRQGAPWDESERITDGAIATLNDYIGHRPVPALETRKLEPYPHEWTRPIPLYVEGAGVAVGRYHDLVECTLKWLQSTDEDLLREAYFAPSLLQELAVDARAYDFEHPVNKRPNYHFGQWDPHCIDNRGNYRRFVVQQVTLDALLTRVDQPVELPRDELLEEAAAVLGGTILMSSGISGSGPDTHDSTTTLSTLLPRIAAFRDTYYERLLTRLPSSHAQRLRQEARRLHQPLGAARQSLNTELSRCRAMQVEHVHLAKIFARMGYPDAAKAKMRAVPVTSARLLCEIDCCLTAGTLMLRESNAADAADVLEKALDVLHRAIQCGAVVDPWNILGFDANFSLFPALENSVRDHRVDELVELMERIFALNAGIWSEAAAVDNQSLCQHVSSLFERTANWWHQFAAHEVQSVQAPPPLETYQAARNVAEALNMWHKGGASAGDIAFWAPHAEMFNSPKAYALVIEALLDRGDFVSSMALLVHWIGQAEQVGLQRGDCSFHQLAQRWLHVVVGQHQPSGALTTSPADETIEAPGLSPTHSRAASAADRWAIARKFLDYLEANADEYWQVPTFRLYPGDSGGDRNPDSDEYDRETLTADGGLDDSDGLYSAAYDGVVFRDSTDDGVEGPVFEYEDTAGDELEAESEAIVDRLAFLDVLARLWRILALARPADTGASSGADDRLPAHDAATDEVLARWRRQASTNQRQLLELLEAVDRYPIPCSSVDQDSLLRYDRQRLIKETLLEQIISACVETMDARRFILAAQRGLAGDQIEDGTWQSMTEGLEEDEKVAINILAFSLQHDTLRVGSFCQQLFAILRDRPILYVPLVKGGSPATIVQARVRQRMIQTLLVWLPRLGLLTETCRLVETTREMERDNPMGPGAVTQFDESFEHGFRAIVESLIRAATTTENSALTSQKRSSRNTAPEVEKGEADEAAEAVESSLVDCLERVTESLLATWLSHSRTLRLSVLERVSGEKRWKNLVAFIRRYGGDIFSQRFMNLGNLRAILHQGAENWLEQLAEELAGTGQMKLIDEIGDRLSMAEAAEYLSLVLEAIVENYMEYRDYNSTTTQSDRGDMLYTLLDFLRLRAAYDRVVWNLKPVILAHEILVRNGCNEAAQLWRRALSDRISDEAEQYLKRLSRLQKKHAMRMSSVADRLGERFLRTMMIDRMRALVEPAMRYAGRTPADHAFEILEEETTLLLRESTGVGIDLPTWLRALDEEVELVENAQDDFGDVSRLAAVLPARRLTLDEVHAQLSEW